MHEDLSRPLRAASDENACECKCTASVRDGESASVENVRQANFLATQNDIGG